MEAIQNLELPVKEVAAILKIPDSTKVRKTGPARLNLIGETFHESRVLNREARIAHLKERLQEIAKVKAERAAKEKEEAEKPVLEWLKEKNYALQDLPLELLEEQIASWKLMIWKRWMIWIEFSSWLMINSKSFEC